MVHANMHLEHLSDSVLIDVKFVCGYLGLQAPTGAGDAKRLDIILLGP